MRVLLLSALLFIFVQLQVTTVSAQQNFAPPGASWHHDMPFGSFHSYTDGDTLILGKTSTRIRQVALTKQPEFSHGLHVNNLPDRYVYQSQDTVFVYNTIFSRFTPLYIFSAAEGDTLCLPVLPTEPGVLIGGFQDSTFCVVVDSIRMRMYDTALLRTYFTRDIGVQGSDYGMNWGTATTGAFAEVIGSVYSGLLPGCFSCAFITSDQSQGPGALRCYSDASMHVKLVTNDCDKGGIAAVVRDREVRRGITISPIPADNFISIKSEQPLPIRQVELVSSHGRILLSKNEIEGSQIDVSSLPDGIYFLRLMLKDGSTFTAKLIIQHSGY
jgi:hypothetical protein